MKKRISCFILGAVLAFSLSGCGEQYEDTNGDDVFTLQTITDENIINLDLGASGITYSADDEDTLKVYSAKNFNGVEQIYSTGFLGKSDVSVYIGTMNVRSGNFKLVAINNDEIIYEFPLDAFNETFHFEDLEGDFAIHVAGESASFKFDMEVY